MKNILYLILFVSPTLVYGGHTFGGDYTYRCLGGDNYELELKLYIDCSGSLSVDNLSTHVYNGIGDPLFIEPLNYKGSDSLNILFNYPCTAIPSNLCLEIWTYLDTLHLPDTAGGYRLKIPGCCRADVVTNIPPSSSFSYYQTISTGISCNTSPTFNNDPPIAVCLNQPFSYDHSAIDIDGDSLVYKLCTPYTQGASNVAPAPPITYTGAYTFLNPLDANPAINIDPNSGLVTFTPTLVGIFAVGICVEEYRSGVLIGETIRDFQFIVEDCPPLVISDFDISIDQGVDQCQQTITTSNSSIGNFYTWDFGDSSTNNDTSSQFDVSYTFNDTGTYIIRLIVDPGTVCADTAYDTVSLKRDEQGFEFPFCDDVPVTLDADTAIANSYLWNTGATTPEIIVSQVETFICEIEADSVCLTNTYHILDCDLIFIPSVFTPNGDGLNDLFTLRRAQGTDGILLRIYDRYGKLVFESSNNNKSWDGSYKKKPVQIGVYVYYIVQEDALENGKNLVLDQGMVTLFR